MYIWYVYGFVRFRIVINFIYIFRAKKKIVLDLRRTKSTENLQAPDRSEATEDLGGSGMDLSGKLVIEMRKQFDISSVVEFERWWVLKSKVQINILKGFFKKSFDELWFVKKCQNRTFKVNFWCQNQPNFFKTKFHPGILI